MKGSTRLCDLARAENHQHWCPATHIVIGPAIVGSPNVTVNSLPAVRVGDAGMAGPCCGPMTWIAQSGSSTVTINGLPAVRIDDTTVHCLTSMGRIVGGSTDVLVGG